MSGQLGAGLPALEASELRVAARAEQRAGQKRPATALSLGLVGGSFCATQQSAGIPLITNDGNGNENGNEKGNEEENENEKGKAGRMTNGAWGRDDDAHDDDRRFSVRF